jgi:hypothetical protein
MKESDRCIRKFPPDNLNEFCPLVKERRWLGPPDLVIAHLAVQNLAATATEHLYIDNQAVYHRLVILGFDRLSTSRRPRKASLHIPSVCPSRAGLPGLRRCVRIPSENHRNREPWFPRSVGEPSRGVVDLAML